MAPSVERSLAELYENDPEYADAEVFGRRPGPSRRGFLNSAGLAALGAAAGGAIPFAANLPVGFVPAALAQSSAPAASGEGTPKVHSPSTSPARTRAWLFWATGRWWPRRPSTCSTTRRRRRRSSSSATTARSRRPPQNPDAWKLTVDGEVNNRLELTLAELKSRFQPKTYRMVLECGGNGRSFFQPQARGNQWTNGGAGCAEWTGVPLARGAPGRGAEGHGEVHRPITAPIRTSRATRPRIRSRAACRSPRRWSRTA